MLLKPVVLAIDDSQIILAKIVQVLESEYHVIPALGGKAALKYLERQIPDMVLLDHEMPEINGFDVLRHIKSNPRTKGIPVLFLTGTTDPKVEVAALREGAVDYIQKPVIDEVILGRMQTHLELRNYRLRLEELVKEKTDEIIKKSREIKMREELTYTLLAYVTDYRDSITGGHVVRTTEYVKILVNAFQREDLPGYEVDDEFGDLLITSAKLHDIGKISVPDRILLKPGRLTEEEFEVIKLHTVFGAKLLTDALDSYPELNNTEFLKVALEMILTHQEKWNGTGYPKGLKGLEIPVSGRIMTLADVYDAITSPRSYKAAMSHEVAYSLIMDEAGISLDPVVVEVFHKEREQFRERLRMLNV